MAPQHFSADVIIVGAGLSGLTSARELITAGLSVLVLEARDRVGGKTYSVPREDRKGKVEHGAAWINDSNQKRMWALAKEFGLETVVQNISGRVVAQGFDGEVVGTFEYGGLPPFPSADQSDIARIRDDFEALCWDETLDLAALDSQTMSQYLETQNASPAATASAAIWTRAMLGVEPSQLSALFFRNYCRSGGGLLQMRSDRTGGGQHLRLRAGTQSFCTHLAASLPANTVHLSEPVTKVSSTPTTGAEVTTSENVYRAHRIILSIPTPTYKNISFTPALSAQKQRLTSATRYGVYIKAILSFRTPFWQTKPRNLCGLAQSFVGPAAVVRDTSVAADGNHNLTCFVAGDPGRAWNALPKSQQLSSLIKQLAVLFADGDEEVVRREFVEFTRSEWGEDEWTGFGCPCPSTAPGVLTQGGEALATQEGVLHFVGTETAGVWMGYMEGAVESGERGAREVREALGRA